MPAHAKHTYVSHEQDLRLQVTSLLMHSCTSRDACQCLASSPTPALTPKHGHRARRREKTSHTPRQVHDSQNERPSETDRGKQRAAQQPECLAMTCSLEGRPHPRAACLASAFGSTRICRMGAAAPAHGCCSTGAWVLVQVNSGWR